MRKLIFVIILCLIFVPTLAAQALDGEVSIPTLGFKFDVPGSWVSNGTNVAETQADLTALTDNNDTTQPTGHTITITTLPLANHGADLDEAVASLIPNAQTEEVSMMGRRSLSVSGVSTQGRAGMVDFWVQGEDLVVFTFAVPALTPAETTLWQTILASVEPIIAEDIEVTTVESEELALEMTAPSDWNVYTDDDSIGFFETEGDIQSFQNNQVTSGSTMFVTVQTLESMELASDTTLDELKEWMGFDATNEGVIDEGEFLILENEGFGFRDIDPAYGNFIIITLSDDGIVNFYNLSTPDEDALERWTPVFLNLLKSLKPVE